MGIARLQRILSGIELFALVLWVGALFFVVAFSPQPIGPLVTDAPEAGEKLSEAMLARFHAVEIVLGLVIIASNFVKVAFFRRVSPLQRGALLACVLMLMFSLGCSKVLRKRIDDKRQDLARAAVSPVANAQQDYDDLRLKYRVVMCVNFALGLFMVYAYRSFEERKVAAIARVLRDNGSGHGA